MRRAILIGMATLALALTACGNSSTKSATAKAPQATVLASLLKIYTVALVGADEVPPTGLPGKGTAIITLDADKEEICYKLEVSDIKLPATEAHIHQGAVKTSGPVVVHLAPPGTNGISSGCVTDQGTTIKDILANPADYYVNVHNADRPNGVLRGQLK